MFLEQLNLALVRFVESLQMDVVNCVKLVLVVQQYNGLYVATFQNGFGRRTTTTACIHISQQTGEGSRLSSSPPH